MAPAASRNRLSEETSPYLRQHKDNPVHWYAWGDEAFTAARESNRPILLSVGYAACHWCHVMAHESFENPEIAALMNDLFINIKVDREERPDVDALYQGALSMIGERGGWPLTMFLTSAGEPFIGGTYFPSERRYGRPSFPDVLSHVSQIFHEQPDRVRHNADSLKEGLIQVNADGAATAPPLSIATLNDLADSLVQHLDPHRGGVGQAPKFPMPFAFDFLWRAWLRTGDQRFRLGVIKVLGAMSEGGIYDHLGGGFARYSTDDDWLVPHFEKMLYDNAQLIELMTLVWKDTKSTLLAQRTAETIAWLDREMTGENGAFCATLDADSEGEEGRYYVWTADEINALLPPEDAALFKEVYDVTPGGNWEGKVILNRSQGLTVERTEDLESRLQPMRETLLAAREIRIRPGRDDKVLADWNGLAIAALTQAGLTFDRPDWIARARRAYAGILSTMTHGMHRLGHALCQGRLQTTALLEDYAAMIKAALALYEGTGEASFLDQAKLWTDTVEQHYRDPAGRGYFQSADDAGDMIVRVRSIADTSQPAGNGMMVHVLARLFLLTGEQAFRDRGDAVVRSHGDRILQQFPHTATALSGLELLAEGLQVVLVDDDGTLSQVVALSPLATFVVGRISSGHNLPEGHPARGKTAIDGKPTAYVCEAGVCGLPITDARVLLDTLGRKHSL
ncbi:MAG: thioredoxin domain-containing protein [Rhodospirillum sp.]|nr:thioredoxin domain-containing protein [Rhodospirillum sp.]MCF8491633.1 thioredoxin domain-containing protein [Rhodospirillum sp.]MCF8500126.1 thioredoxin domain-containing protein [Rhodospirillum sp.]